VQPLENLRLTRQRPTQIHGVASRRQAVGLLRGTQVVRAVRQQPRTIHSEQTLGVRVGIDEQILVRVDDHDRLRSVVHEDAVAGFALAQSELGLAPIRHIAQADDEHVARPEPRAADRALGRKHLPAPASAPDLAARELEMRVPRAIREALQPVRHRAAIDDLRQQQRDALSDDLALGITEEALAGRIERLHSTVLVDGEHRVLDVIQDHLQMVRALLARLVFERAGFIGHEPHRACDAATLVVDRLVMSADALEKLVDVERRGALGQTQLRQELLQMRVQLNDLVSGRGNLRADDGCRKARVRT